jgi:anti-sigma regulatory factor (Ser/Thr protein kinase)
MTTSARTSRREAPSLSLSLERNVYAPSLARAAVLGFTQSSDYTLARASTLALLVSELVSNAVLHSEAAPESEILLSASLLDGGAIRIEVTDRGGGFTPVPRDPAREGGYGLYLVEKEASSWGIERSDGTCVWFEMEAPGG